MSYNSVEELYSFLSLTAEDVQPSVVEQSLTTAYELVIAFAPEDGSDRAARMLPVRKVAERHFAASEVFQHFANSFFLSQPPIRLLNVLSFGAGADSPTPTELLSALNKVSEDHRDKAFFWLKRAHPKTTAIQAGS